MDKILKNHKLSKLMQKEIDKLNGPILIKFEFVVENIPIRKEKQQQPTNQPNTSRSDDLMNEFQHKFKGKKSKTHSIYCCRK